MQVTEEMKKALHEAVMEAAEELGPDVVIKALCPSSLRAQADARPVAIRVRATREDKWAVVGADESAQAFEKLGWETEPLYTHPAEASAPGLSDDDIESEWRMSVGRLWPRSTTSVTASDLVKFAKGILTRASAATAGAETGLNSTQSQAGQGSTLVPNNAATVGEPTHPDDEAVDRFAAAMKQKLAQAREKGRGGWQQCDPVELSIMLREHVEKGDPRDVANFCMFLWNLGKPISDAALPYGKRAAQQQAEPGADEFRRGVRESFNYLMMAAANTDDDRRSEILSDMASDLLEYLSPADHTTWKTGNQMYQEGVKEGERRAAQSGQRAGVAETAAARDVLAERARQISAEGWTPAHDDKHHSGEIAVAASIYAWQGNADYPKDTYPSDGHPPPGWPWSPEWWKPRSQRRNLVKAGALILAEIERLDRAAAAIGESDAAE